MPRRGVGYDEALGEALRDDPELLTKFGLTRREKFSREINRIVENMSAFTGQQHMLKGARLREQAFAEQERTGQEMSVRAAVSRAALKISERKEKERLAELDRVRAREIVESGKFVDAGGGVVSDPGTALRVAEAERLGAQEGPPVAFHDPIEAQAIQTERVAADPRLKAARDQKQQEELDFLKKQEAIKGDREVRVAGAQHALRLKELEEGARYKARSTQGATMDRKEIAEFVEHASPEVRRIDQEIRSLELEINKANPDDFAGADAFDKHVGGFTDKLKKKHAERARLAETTQNRRAMVLVEDAVAARNPLGVLPALSYLSPRLSRAGEPIEFGGLGEAFRAMKPLMLEDVREGIDSHGRRALDAALMTIERRLGKAAYHDLWIAEKGPGWRDLKAQREAERGLSMTVRKGGREAAVRAARGGR